MKRWAVLLMVTLLAVSAAAQAAVPSKTTEDMATVVAVASASGAPLAAEIILRVAAEGLQAVLAAETIGRPAVAAVKFGLIGHRHAADWIACRIHGVKSG